MGKDTRLVNIYLKIHHKQPLTMDDLAYLAEYAPECFEKTCKNVVYNIPETAYPLFIMSLFLVYNYFYYTKKTSLFQDVILFLQDEH